MKKWLAKKSDMYIYTLEKKFKFVQSLKWHIAEKIQFFAFNRWVEDFELHFALNHWNTVFLEIHCLSTALRF